MTKISVPKNQSKQVVITKSGDYLVELQGPGAHADILGGFHISGNDKLNIDVRIIHTAKSTSANTFIRAVVEDSSSANISGKIIVKKGAQQTNSFLRENVLLVGQNAKATAVPDLEIEADEVKCSHAATVGKIDEEQLFYLMSRGINKAKAQQLIIDGFLEPVNQLINN